MSYTLKTLQIKLDHPERYFAFHAHEGTKILEFSMPEKDVIDILCLFPDKTSFMSFTRPEAPPYPYPVKRFTFKLFVLGEIIDDHWEYVGKVWNSYFYAFQAKE